VREIRFAPEALDALDDAYDRNAKLGESLDEALDWIEEEPPNIKAKRRSFAGGKYYIEVRFGDEDWLIIWAEDANEPTAPRVLYLGKSFL